MTGAVVDPLRFCHRRPHPAAPFFDRQQFEAHTVDLRLMGDVGERHSMSVGLSSFRDDSPRERLRSADIDGAYAGDLIYRQLRDTRYAAAFAEAILRFDRLTLASAVRYEDVSLGIGEPVQQMGLTRAPIDRRFDRRETLVGLGTMYKLGADH